VTIDCFHVDRRGTLQLNQGSVLNGSPYNFELASPQALMQYFPESLSRFGQHHVTTPHVPGALGRVPSGFLEEYGGRQALEYIWEHQRRQVNPQALSRLQAAFASPTLDAARFFARNRYYRDGSRPGNTPHVRIWRMRAEVGHQADMNWLPWNGGLTGLSSPFTLAQLVYCAQRYWQGIPRPGHAPFWELLLSSFHVRELAEDYDASERGQITPLPTVPGATRPAFDLAIPLPH
jgi:hypothetical protein